MTDETHARLVLVAVDPRVRGMSRLADDLEAEPILSDRVALTQRVALEGDDCSIAVVVPTTHPETILEAVRLGVHRVAALHAPEAENRHPSLVRAAYGMVDLVITTCADTIEAAIAAGADPDRTTVVGPGVVERLYDEPARRTKRGAYFEAAVSLGLDALAASGVLRALEIAAPDRGVNVVNYHRVLPLAEVTSYCRPQMAIAAPIFAAQLEAFAERRGFTPVDRVRDADAKDKVAITFDDGYEDNFRVALPLLDRFSTPACIFIVTNLIGQADALWWDRVGYALFVWWRNGAEGPLPSVLPGEVEALRATVSSEEARTIITNVLSELNLVSAEQRDAAVAAADGLVPDVHADRTMLTWAEIEAMAAAGVMFGSHTQSHTPLDELPLDRAKEELFGGQADLEARLGERPYRATALPRGRLGDLTKDDLRAGFDAVMTTEPKVNRVDGDDLFVHRRDGRMLTLAGRHHPAKLRLELTGIVDRLRDVYRYVRS